MYYGTVIRNVTDLRAEPKFQSERKSQLLFNEPLNILSRRSGYLHIEQTDGYTGWVSESAVEIISYRKFKSAVQSSEFLVALPTVSITSWTDIQSLPRFLFYGTGLTKRNEKKGNCEVEALNGARFLIPGRGIASAESVARGELGAKIVKEAKQFIASPYLWGGITPFGYDCSGLVKMICARFGIKLPRDSKDQRSSGAKIELSEIKAGDLLFFTGHVAIAIDKKRLIHASLKAGGVAIESLNPEHIGYRPDLVETFREARRIVR